MENKVETTVAPSVIWRRLLEPMPDWLVFFPLIFAVGVVGLLFLYRKERRLAFLIWAGSFVAVFAAIYLPLAFLLKKEFSWVVVVFPVMAVALIYVGLMYVKDARSVHPAWAGFLGLLRCTVYGVLAVVFFLPGCQNIETVRTESKVVFIFDVSKSMNTADRDPLPEEIARSIAPSRKREVIRLLNRELGVKGRESANTLQMVLEKSPLTIYRFGGILDEKDVKHFKSYDEIKNFDWDSWLNPDPDNVPDVDPGITKDMSDKEKEELQRKADERKAARRNDLENLLNSTNVYGALEKVSRLEATNYLQSIVVFSDGYSHSGSEDALRDFLGRMEKPNPPINVITVGVGGGEVKEKVKVEITEILAPSELRAEDKFPLHVYVTGEGLRGDSTKLDVELMRFMDKEGRKIASPPIKLAQLKKNFEGAGDSPRAKFEYKELDLRVLTDTKGKDEKSLEALQGKWRITARVPTHSKEKLKEKFHTLTSEFQVVGKKLRVLLVASGPQRDYQFVRTLFYREALEKRMDFAVFLQSGAGQKNIDQDVDPEKLLHKFPDRMGTADKDNPYSTLSAFDVIIAFDPDWSLFAPEQLKLLSKWVENAGGGIIFIAGPINTYQLSERQDAKDENGMYSLLKIVPLLLKDSRLHVLNFRHDATKPNLLNFTKEGEKAEYSFLKIDDTEPGPLGGWDKFFHGGDGKPDPTKTHPKRGFHWYYPVEDRKPATQILATIASPPEARVKIDGADMDPPILAVMAAGRGKTAYIGTGETWRLRMAKELFHDRFWVNLARYCSSGITQEKKYGSILAGKRFNLKEGDMDILAEIMGENLLPLDPRAKPDIEVKKLDKFGTARPVKFELKAKRTPGEKEFGGLFEGKVRFTEEGDYILKIKVPGTTEYLPEHKVTVFKPNEETDDTRPDFAALYAAASEAAPFLKALDLEVAARIEESIEIPQTRDGKNPAGLVKQLYMPIKKADGLYEMIQRVPPRENTAKGAVNDFWDDPLWETGVTVNAKWLVLLIPIGVGLLGFAILMFIGQYLFAVLFLSGFTLVGLIGGAIGFFGGVPWPDLPVDFSFVLTLVVGLLAAEWLTRKLLKLA